MIAYPVLCSCEQSHCYQLVMKKQDIAFRIYGKNNSGNMEKNQKNGKLDIFTGIIDNNEILYFGYTVKYGL